MVTGGNGKPSLILSDRKQDVTFTNLHSVIKLNSRGKSECINQSKINIPLMSF